MSKFDILTRKKMEADLKASLRQHIEQWVEANCADNPEWAENWFAPETPERMTDAAWLVFKSSHDGQRFQKENG